MAYLAQMIEKPDALPGWYPPPNDDDPGAYPVRFQWMQTPVYFLSQCGAVEYRAPEIPAPPDAPAPAAAFEKGGIVPPAQCSRIAKACRGFMKGVEPYVYEDLRGYWDHLQARLKADVEARGEIAISGFEPFPYTLDTLRSDIVHWGAFNALAAEHGGYQIS